MENLGINLGFLLVQIANFAIIFVVLRAWVYKPLLGMLEKRKLVVAQGLEDARVAAEARENAEKEASEIVNQAQIKANDVLKEATERAESVRREILAAAEADANKKREVALAELDQERNRMLAELRTQVVSLAMAGAQKLIEESLTHERQRSLLKEFFSGVKSGDIVILNANSGAGGGSDGPAEVTSALPLTPDEQETIKSQVLSRMGGCDSIVFRVDPGILGGLVVRVGDRVIDSSVAGQLQMMRQSLQ